MQQSPAGIEHRAPGSNSVVWGHEVWLEVSEGTDACIVNRIEGPQFVRITLYVLQDYLRSPKTNKLPQHHQQTLVVFLHTMCYSTAIPNGWITIAAIYPPTQKSAGYIATWGWRVLPDFTRPISSISREQGWLCVWSHAKRETGKELTVTNVLQPECDVNICMQCVHNIRYLCTTLINTMLDSSFTKPVNDLEELAMKDSLVLLRKKKYPCT